MKLLLIAPADVDMAGQPGKQLHHLSLAIIAALAAPDFDEVEIVEEHHTALDLNARADLVGITMMTCQAPRGYWLADHFRRRGIPTIAGGSHASFMVDQVLEHFDSVVIGEVEPVWAEVMAGFKAGKLAPSYKAAKLPDLRDLPMPRKDLFKGKTTLNAGIIQTTRGCPLGCGYCTVTTMYGREYRTRPVEAVVEEIRRYPSKNFLIIDDNVFFSHAYSRQLFEALIPLKIKWVSQASLELASRDKSLLKLAARAGCVGLFVGIESLDQDTLNAAHKRFNHVQRFEEQLLALRRAGIGIVGAFMFGFDRDTPATFDRVYDFAVRNKLATIAPAIMTPLPGTALYRSMDSSNLIVDRDWRNYSCEILVTRHPTMSRAEIHDRYDGLSRRFYSWGSIARRFWGNLSHPLFYLGMNLANRARIYNLASTNSMLAAAAKRSDLGSSSASTQSCSAPNTSCSAPTPPA